MNTKFLGMDIDDHINWQNCIEEVIPKLSGACYAVMLLGQWSIPVTLTHSAQFTVHAFILL